ncbi:hypothetical protein D1BOALGB6SA_3248 [Olavius sp. associated proteobacterium Delta 1]|nr:hypothetical protein D1BOALGB6SA_3248 [Olavius sp. associated proteobacterium Delta 1]
MAEVRKLRYFPFTNQPINYSTNQPGLQDATSMIEIKSIILLN